MFVLFLFFFLLVAKHSSIQIVTLKVKVQESDFVTQSNRFTLHSAKAQPDPTHVHSKAFEQILADLFDCTVYIRGHARPLHKWHAHILKPSHNAELAVTTMTIIH